MSTFTLRLFSADRTEVIENVTSFTGEDKSGSFGLLARHERFMTVLTFGLSRLLLADGSREYLGFPGGLLYLSTMSCVSPPGAICATRTWSASLSPLTRELLEEEQVLAETRHKLHRLEAEMLKRLAQLGME
ncbi:MAG: hypothetical protein WDM70_10000 [Nitrosomonadales bacterium]